MTHRNGRKRTIPLRGMIGLSWGAAAMAALALIWLFYALFFNLVHTRLYERQMDRTAALAADAVLQPEAEQEAERIAREYAVCIYAYRVLSEQEAELSPGLSYIYSGNEGIWFSCVLQKDNSFGCLLQSVTPAGLLELYVRVQQADGGLSVLEEDACRLTEDAFTQPAEQGRLLHARMVTAENGERYLLLLDGSARLSEAEQESIFVQLLLFSLLFTVTTLLSTLLLSERLSKPIERMNRAAHSLSTGRYEDGAEGGITEIAELDQTLKNASVELSSVEQMQKELLANISHDLRTPLTMIIGYAEVMRDLEGENTPENVQVIIDEATRLSELVSDMLQLSKTQGDRLDKTIFDLCGEVSATVTRYRQLRAKDGFSFPLETEEHGYVYADRGKIMQVLCNLLNNAISYSGNSREVGVRCITVPEGLRVEVTDHGIGIAADELPNIWKRYYKVDRSHQRVSTGSGLGLSIVRQVLELHQARYGVESELGKGSTFWFILPKVEKPNRS